MKKYTLSVLFAVLFLVTACAKPPKQSPLYWPMPPDPPRIKFIRSINSSREVKKETFFTKLKELITGGSAAEGLAKPFGVFAKSDKLYVADSMMRVVRVFDFKESKFSTIGRGGTGQLIKPLDVFVDDSGRVYVCDATAKKIIVYDKDFKFIRAIGKKGEFERPSSIVVNEELERIYVTDILRHKVYVYDLKGNKLFEFGQRGVEEGEFNYPNKIAIDKEGKLFVVDSMNFRVQMFDSDGRFTGKFGQVGDQFGQFTRPKGIALDTDGHIYVTDAAFNNIQIFNKEGKLMLFFSNMGYKRGELWMPAGIAIDEKNRIYVADQYNHRVQVYQYLSEEEGEKILAEEEKKSAGR